VHAACFEGEEELEKLQQSRGSAGGVQRELRALSAAAPRCQSSKQTPRLLACRHLQSSSLDAASNNYNAKLWSAMQQHRPAIHAHLKLLGHQGGTRPCGGGLQRDGGGALDAGVGRALQTKPKGR